MAAALIVFGIAFLVVENRNTGRRMTVEEMGEITKKLYDTLTGIQMGTIEAPEGWIRKIL